MNVVYIMIKKNLWHFETVIMSIEMIIQSITIHVNEFIILLFVQWMI